MLGQLVAFDTVSSRPNRALIEAVAEYLRAHDVDAIRVDGLEDGKAGLWWNGMVAFTAGVRPI